MDEYKLAIDALVKSPRIEITEYAYDEIEKSCEALRIALRIEERYEIFLRNFIDLEKELLSISLKNMISSECSYFKCSEERISLNQRIINLLSSSRSYLEQSIKYDVACVLGESGKKLYTKIVYKLKIESNSFNFIEELRNHIQHNGLPVDTYSINRSWDEGFKHLETSCRITADKGKLAEDGDWEKRKALDPMPEKINVIKLLREYVNFISGIHCDIREMLKNKVKAARELVEGHIQSYIQGYSDSVIGLKAIHFSNGKKVEVLPLFLKWDDVRLELEKKNQRILNMEKRHVTSKLKSE